MAKDVGLVMCPIWDADSPQLGLPLLKAHLNARGHRAFALDLAIRLFRDSAGEDARALGGVDRDRLTEPGFVRAFFDRHAETVDRAIEELLDSGARTFGFSLYYCTLESTVEFARRLKRRDPSRAVVFGGPECVRFRASALAAADVRRWLEPADAWIPGEGETALAALLERRAGERLRRAPGAFVRADGAFEDGGPGSEAEDLDALPFPDFSDYRLQDYRRPDQLVTYMTRGCIRRCTFCDVNFYWGGYRARTGRRVFEEISRQLSLHPGVRRFWFCDSIVNADMKALRSFCELMIEARRNGGPEVRWEAYAIVRGDMTAEFARLLAAAGCERLHIGIESGSQRVLDRMKKGYHVPVAERVLRELHAAGIRTVMLLMVGFPGETEDDFEETLRFVGRTARTVDCVNPSESLTYLGPGTDLGDHAEQKYGVDPARPHSEYWRTLDGRNTYPIRVHRFERLCAEVERSGGRLAPRVGSTELAAGRMLGGYLRFAEGPERRRGLAERLRTAIDDPAGALLHYLLLVARRLRLVFARSDENC